MAATARWVDAVKTEQTLRLERNIWRATSRQGVFGCYEVTIGWFGHERVDYMTYDTKGVFRCYEIKVSKSDFHSPSATTFCGHYNYYVMPWALYEQVKDEIPSDIGVYCEARGHDGTAIERAPCVSVKKAKRRELSVSADVLKDSIIRSLCRDVGKQIASGSPTLIEYYQREVAGEKRMAAFYRKEYDKLREQYDHLYQTVRDTYGEEWERGPGVNYADSI